MWGACYSSKGVRTLICQNFDRCVYGSCNIGRDTTKMGCLVVEDGTIVNHDHSSAVER